MAYNSFHQAAERPRINGRVRSITEMGGHSSVLGARDTADRMQRAGIVSAASGMRTRDDNIAAARANGTFDARRNAFNAANKGSFMDEAGRIGPRAPGTAGAATSPPATSFVSAPDGQGGSKQVKVPSLGSMVSAASSPKPTAKATTSPAMPTGIGMVDAVTKQVSTKPAASQGSGFTSMPPGSRDLYAEEKAREKNAPLVAQAPSQVPIKARLTGFSEVAGIPRGAPTGSTMSKTLSVPPGGMREAASVKTTPPINASAPDPLMKQAQALGNAAKIANSRETAAVMAKAKASLPSKPTSMVAAASSPAPSGAAFGAARSKPLVAAASQPKAPAVAAQAQATIPKPAAPTSTPVAPKPSWMDRKIAANPDGIFGKVADVAGKTKRGFVSAAKAVAPVAANLAADYYNATVAAPANAVRGAIQKRAGDNPMGAAAKLAKKIPGMADEASKTAKKKAKPIVTASN